jgi:hypothetical protein
LARQPTTCAMPWRAANWPAAPWSAPTSADRARAGPARAIRPPDTAACWAAGSPARSTPAPPGDQLNDWHAAA